MYTLHTYIIARIQIWMNEILLEKDRNVNYFKLKMKLCALLTITRLLVIQSSLNGGDIGAGHWHFKCLIREDSSWSGVHAQLLSVSYKYVRVIL